jgi:glyoxylase-like metal-dependent hydrolase (beta-lactamase superfamily II)
MLILIIFARQYFFMKLHVVIAENWKMDGGVAFGVVPQTIWKKLAGPDENNMVKITSRCLLIETNGRLILVDTGMGRKQSEKYYGFRFLFGEENFENGFHQLGYSFDDVTDVLFTHLHDDHCGGAVKLSDDGNPELVFKNAKHYCSKDQWQWANNPNKREVGSFFQINFAPIMESGKMKLLIGSGEFYNGISYRIVNGHTQGMIIPSVEHNGRIFVFMADFIPSAAHIPIPFIASVDIQPLIALKEKEEFLNEAAEKGYILIFEHDYDTEACTVKHTEKGVRVDKSFSLEEIL